MNLDVFKKKIKAYLENTNTAKSKLEREANLTNSTIRNILNGKKKNPTIDTVIKIADVLDCSLDDLFDGKVKSKKNSS